MHRRLLRICCIRSCTAPVTSSSLLVFMSISSLFIFVSDQLWCLLRASNSLLPFLPCLFTSTWPWPCVTSSFASIYSYWQPSLHFYTSRCLSHLNITSFFSVFRSYVNRLIRKRPPSTRLRQHETGSTHWRQLHVEVFRRWGALRQQRFPSHGKPSTKRNTAHKLK